MEFGKGKILVPVDGSENSEKGLRYACWLANKLGATITVLYVVAIPYTGESALFHIDQLETAGRMVLEEAKKIVKEENCAQAHYELRQGIGNPGHEIVKFSKEMNFSLIVMSAKGHTALGHLIMGSVSDMVVHQAPCPVLIVR
jgi:nucleotide-binding universal stress UspA family protein